MKVALALLFLLLMASCTFAWTDTYDMLLQVIGFKAPRVFSYNNFAVEWINENPDGTLTIHLIEVN